LFEGPNIGKMSEIALWPDPDNKQIFRNLVPWIQFHPMAESLLVSGSSRQEKYESLLPQIKALVEGETDRIANMANCMAALHSGMGFFWVGVYFVRGEELVLGPFQGPVACTRIQKGKGVCGHCFETRKTVIVEDVDEFPGHIACSSLSRSEIVVPLFNVKNELIAVLDVDSENLGDFDETDRFYLEKLALILGGL
jgi:L-methionine (R)-S-oxide reductase